MRTLIVVLVLLTPWSAYLGATGHVVYQVYIGDPNHILHNYFFGTGMLWALLGYGLWQITTNVDD